ncbi:hypothetical protein [Streptomyces lydicus]|uniref:hypothetical protein n=1 Tax=Streptomyces lydicus TaxID=47763 RepID=UPI0036EC86A5
MHATVLSAVQIAVTLVAWMITGFTRLPGRWLRWKMFCRATFTIVVRTAVWFFDALASGFQHPTDPGRLQYFRIIFCVVLTVRFALSIGQGGWDRLHPARSASTSPSNASGLTRLNS